jgi:hypothetical protein
MSLAVTICRHAVRRGGRGRDGEDALLGSASLDRFDEISAVLALRRLDAVGHNSDLGS